MRKSSYRTLSLSPRPWRWTATLFAMAGVAITILLFHQFLSPHLPTKWHDPALAIILLIGTGFFSYLVFGMLSQQQIAVLEANQRLEKQRDGLNALREASYAMTTVGDWTDIVQNVVDVARRLTGAKYAALAVLEDDETYTIRQFFTSGVSADQIHQIGQYPTGRGLLGEVIRHRRPIRLQRLQDHPASIGFPPHHPHMENFLGLPLLYQSQVMGHLYLTEKADGFTADDQAIVELFARQAAAVIANARFYQEREVFATLKERERIGRDLHDGVLQTLYGITLSLDNLVDSHDTLDQDTATELNRISETLGLLMTEIRFFIQSLESTSIDFRIALADMLRRLGPMDDITMTFNDERYLELHPDRIHDLLLSIQEAVSNARIHGHSHHIVIEWTSTDEFYQVTIKDDGEGFVYHPDTTHTHFGIRNMTKRIERWHGQVHIDSQRHVGTTVTLQIPWL
ncbi:Histidine kinase-like ATPase domain-containing protein [Sulfobacillus thermosulfidooxidans DSM 9293]|uniref:histidine kinase n=2 Tax=Sulfobacillus thermosulfidooxidans TaxID=28034 RepID=A0A1W1WIN5_SULTA|nr:GAF domain-containing protein [Sulfobacillus thermosulfidooxidans]PSR28268.1 MAG: histidine kinase [Sulfobacillus thermosulfidooxidans]SMC05593.1 Histidine kinase-like ATPase domain-containing protein [Sulfobacillus thermosulfidooxidans DSM 9293]